MHQFPGIRFVVIAGGDWVVPFNRVPIKRYTTDLDLEWQSENAYLAKSAGRSQGA
ncbi:MAG: hypothetical protein IPK16_30540 [Anaerolineales bacterium]|nr:hypothetical protein [Anaerolineales bacterium]